VGETHTVAQVQETFIDFSRGVEAYGDYPGAGWRVLPTTVWFPSSGRGPYPLVVFAHGFATTPAAYAPLLSRIAAAGYVVAAPTYPLLSGEPAGPTDSVGWVDLYADTRFVTDEVLRVLGGFLVDPDRIAVAGHSDGALLAFADGYTPYRLDPRVRGVIAYAAELGGFDVYQPNDRPILHFVSDQDEYNPYDETIEWDRNVLQQPKTTVSLWNASHAGPYMDPNDPHFDMVALVTIGWLDTVLKAQPEGLFYAGIYVGARPSLGAIE
jgi:dienelactone hydrolase